MKYFKITSIALFNSTVSAALAYFSMNAVRMININSQEAAAAAMLWFFIVMLGGPMAYMGLLAGWNQIKNQRAAHETELYEVPIFMIFWLVGVFFNIYSA